MVCAMLVSGAMAAPASAVTNEQFSLEMTYTGAGDLTQTRLPYAAKKGKPVRCNFPPGPAP